MKKSIRPFLLVIAACLLTPAIFAHSINYALENAPDGEVVSYYCKLGFSHIIPNGLDHILFVMGLSLLSTNIKTILWQATAFTVAHSITLELSMKNIIIAPGAIVEPIIALSILFIAVENLLLAELKPWRIALVFLFGLIHGMGFASALNEIGLPNGKFYTSIIAFNAGVELGQITIIAALYTLIILPLKNKTWYRTKLVYGLSAGIGLVAAFWTFERIFY
jgi:hypothetical protein